MALSTGEILQDRYRIVSLLGEGGMGAVYQAWDIRLNVPVAMKEMLSQPGLDPKALVQLRRQFLQEAQVLARLDHPRLVRVTDFFSQNDSEYLVMNFVKGESLVDRIEQMGVLPEPQVLVWAGHLLDTLAYCHSQGVIHRDVKPQNVIIRPDEQAVLADFGLVKLWDPHDPRTRTAMRGMGTPQYAPPEQYETDMGHTDARSDIYSVGATLYHALTGQTPLTATQRIADPDQFVPLRDIVPEVSKQTETAVMRAMELARADRWQNAKEMAKNLKPARHRRGPPATVRLEQGRTVVIPAGRPSVPGQRQRVPMWAWGLGGLAVLLVAVGLVIGLGGGGDSTPTPSSEKTVIPSVPVIVTATALSSTASPPEKVVPVSGAEGVKEVATAMSPSTPVSTPSPAPALTATRQPAETPSPSPAVTATPLPTLTATTAPTPSPTPTLTATQQPTATVTPTRHPTATATATRQPTATATATATRQPTSTPTRTPTRTPTPAETATPTPAPRAVPPEPVSPAQGKERKNPVTFQWQGSLNAGEAYQVTLYHPKSDYTIQSELLTAQEWSIDLPGDRYGEWRWTVSVVSQEKVVAFSSEWMFWFDPSPGGGPKPPDEGPPTVPPP